MIVLLCISNQTFVPVAARVNFPLLTVAIELKKYMLKIIFILTISCSSILKYLGKGNTPRTLTKPQYILGSVQYMSAENVIYTI